MASWIKFDKSLPHKPETVRIAGLLGVPREVVVCRLLAAWAWADEVIGETDILPDGTGVTVLSPADGDNKAFVDTLVGTPGFADALAAVGWAVFRDGRVEFPNFGRHNGETAKTRARNLRTQQQKRSGKATPNAAPKAIPPGTGVTVLSPADGDNSVTRGEERREEEKDTPLPPKGGVAGGVASDEPAKPKRTRRAKRDVEGCPLFARFWAAFPKKTAKPAAARAFAAHDPDDGLLARMLAAIDRQRGTEQWQRDGGAYIPYPATWLNQRRWEDGGSASPTVPPAAPLAGTIRDRIAPFHSFAKPMYPELADPPAGGGDDAA